MMNKKPMAKILNEGDTIKWNKYRQVHPEWVPDLRGIELKSPDSDFDRGANAAFTEKFNLKGSLYDFTTEFPFDFNPEEYGMVLKEGEETIEAISQEKAKSKTDAPDIFISHSSQDLEFVKALVDLIEATLKIKPEIRCTSVPGYKFKTGADTDEGLRREVKNSRLLIGVITPSSMESAFVLFELGGRWIIDKHTMFPVMACGADSSILKGPLEHINATSCYERADIHQLIDDIASELSFEKVKAASYQKKIDRLVELSKNKDKINKQSLQSVDNDEELKKNTYEPYKEAFEAFLRRFESDWVTERDVDSPTFDEGIYKIEDAIEKLLDFRENIKEDDDNEITGIIMDSIKELKILKTYEFHQYDQFWDTGLQIIGELKKVPKVLGDKLK